MKRIGILGDIGSAKSFGYPVFNADYEVAKLYKTNKKIFIKLKKILPKYFKKFPTKKINVLNAILAEDKNLEKIVRIVHKEIQKCMLVFLKRNKKKTLVILDIPLLLENKINKKNDILVFVKSKNSEILKRLKKRKNFNPKLHSKFKNIQLPLDYKKKKSKFVIKNDFRNITVKKSVNNILKKILNERNNTRY